jgi:hypothetical protein
MSLPKYAELDSLTNVVDIEKEIFLFFPLSFQKSKIYFYDIVINLYV